MTEDDNAIAVFKNKLSVGDYRNENYIAKLIINRQKRGKDDGKKKLVEIQTFLPESWMLRIASDFEYKLKSYANAAANMVEGAAESVGGLVAGRAGKALVGGVSTIARAGYDLRAMGGKRSAFERLLSFPTWEGNSPLDLTIPFIFNAVEDAEQEVLLPMRYLMEAVCPELSKDGMSLIAPGPTINFGVNDTNNESIIGEAWNTAKGVASALYDTTAGAGIAKAIDARYMVDLKIGTFFRLKNAIITQVDTTYDSRFDKWGQPISGTANVQIKSLFPPTVQDIKGFFQLNGNYSQLDAFMDLTVAKALVGKSTENGSAPREMPKNRNPVTNTPINTNLGNQQGQITA